MGLDASAVFFYGVGLSEVNVEELKLRDERNGKRYCKECGAWIETHFCPNDGSQTQPKLSMIGLRDLCCWGDKAAQPEHTPYSTNLGLHYIDLQWPSPFYLYITTTRVECGDVRGGPKENEPVEINFFGITRTFDSKMADKVLCDAFKYIGLQWDNSPKFYMALNAGW